MEYRLLDGKATAARLRAEITAEVEQIVKNGGRRPALTAILVGNDPASQTYVANKDKSCKEVGFAGDVLRLPETTTQEELIKIVNDINANSSIDGLIVQLPLPKHINPQAVIAAISPDKDVDGFHPQSAGKMMLGEETFLPATPMGIMTLLKEYKINTAGMNCVVLGRSNIVGRPMANLLSQKGIPGDCTVTMCHSRTKDLAKYTREADIIVAALGIPNFVSADMVKEGAIIVDVGINSVEDKSRKSGYRLVGDVDFDAVAPKCSYITPVPGGVGPMTIVSLMQNTLKAYKAKAL
ncbi:MAG: bifunctional methylenetetrahydrofolate dehydrogenase/methenyltetrahydrofolate cyclohydrolase FolD [Bacteroidales bacterium]|nr:bifunctional methylenetetrahydrofolate dehydrogenase/methenyltetrahydrofolate cyclohydrolase FolD [Bacteroidales bacterium]